MQDEQHYSVKEILDICNISRKQLYLYEEKGLVEPARNAGNRYRTYTKEQAMGIIFIRDCRRIGFSFESIARLINSPSPTELRSEIIAAMKEARRKLDASISRYEHTMTRLTSMLEASALLNVDAAKVTVEHLPEQNILYHEFTGNFYDEPMLFYRQYSRLDKIIEASGYTRLSATKEWFTQVFDEDRRINADDQVIRIFYEIKEDAPADPHFMKIKESDVLTMIHVGSFTAPLVNAYQTIVDYAARHHLQIEPMSFEEHLTEPSFSYNNSDMWVTKVSVPVKS